MDGGGGVRRAVAALLAACVVITLRLGGAGVAAGPGFSVSTLANPRFAGADTEPSLRLGRDGTAYVGAIRGFPRGVDLWRVGPGGAPATYLGSPDSALAGVCCAALGGGDMDLAVADDGTLAYSSLWLGSLTVGRSVDGGRSFVSQPLGSPVVGDDRPWLATDGASFYMSYHDILTGNIQVERSAAGPQAGLTYTPVTPVLAPSDAAVGNNQLGLLLADHRHPGALFQVYTTSSEVGMGLNGGGTTAGQNLVRMATSTDGGTTWSQHTVFRGPPAAGYASVFPAAALDAAGNLYVAVCDNSSVLVFSSSDRGASWRGPVRVDPGGGAVAFPWVAAGGDGGVVVSWLGSPVAGPDAPEGRWDVFAAEAPNGTAAAPGYRLFRVSDRPVHLKGICEQGLGCRSGRELGDFFSAAVGPDGIVSLAWADDGLGGPAVVRLARGGLALGAP